MIIAAVYFLYIIPMVITIMGFIYVKDELDKVNRKDGISVNTSIMFSTLLVTLPIINICFAILFIAKLAEERSGLS